MSPATKRLLPDERRRLIAKRLQQNRSVSIAELRIEFDVSPMTARRDLGELERQGIAQRTHGGAVLPSLSSHEDSFQQRLRVAVDAKERLAEAAVARLEPGESIFIDSSTTAYYAARRIIAENLSCTLLTNAVSTMELACEIDAPQVDLVGAGGKLRYLTRSLVGPQAVRGIEAYFADHVLFSVQGITDDGHLTDPDALEAEVKRAMIRRGRQVILMVDGSKFDRAALSQIGSIDDVDTLVAADVHERYLAALDRFDLELVRA